MRFPFRWHAIAEFARSFRRIHKTNVQRSTLNATSYVELAACAANPAHACRNVLGAQAASLFVLAACQERRVSASVRFAKMLPAGCRQLRAGSPRSPEVFRAEQHLFYLNM